MQGLLNYDTEALYADIQSNNIERIVHLTMVLIKEDRVTATIFLDFIFMWMYEDNVINIIIDVIHTCDTKEKHILACLKGLSHRKDIRITQYAKRLLQKHPNMCIPSNMNMDPHGIFRDVCYTSGDVEFVKFIHSIGGDILKWRGFDGRSAMSISKTQGHVTLVDYMLELGKPLPKTTTPNYILVRKRRACRDAVMALYGVFLKRCKFNRDIARNMLKPMVWETRLDPKWDLSRGGVARTKKRK